jgi:hypothetical protein
LRGEGGLTFFEEASDEDGDAEEGEGEEEDGFHFGVGVGRGKFLAVAARRAAEEMAPAMELMTAILSRVWVVGAEAKAAAAAVAILGARSSE